MMSTLLPFMNPRYTKQHVAQSIIILKVHDGYAHTACIFPSNSGVIGSPDLRVLSDDFLRLPFSTYESIGRDISDGSGRPDEIW